MTNMEFFKQRIQRKLKEWNMKEEDCYFSQMRDGYYMDYKPKYPESSNGDCTIFWNGEYTTRYTIKVSVYGNFDALIPTINIIVI